MLFHFSALWMFEVTWLGLVSEDIVWHLPTFWYVHGIGAQAIMGHTPTCGQGLIKSKLRAKGVFLVRSLVCLRLAWTWSCFCTTNCVFMFESFWYAAVKMH